MCAPDRSNSKPFNALALVWQARAALYLIVNTMTFLTRFLGATLLAAASLASHAQAPQPPEIAAKSYLLVDVTAGQTLAAKDADSLAAPSTTDSSRRPGRFGKSRLAVATRQ